MTEAVAPRLEPGVATRSLSHNNHCPVPLQLKAIDGAKRRQHQPYPEVKNCPARKTERPRQLVSGGDAPRRPLAHGPQRISTVSLVTVVKYVERPHAEHTRGSNCFVSEFQ